MNRFGPPKPLAPSEYEAIEQAMMETSRGRWFLAEFADRNRRKDTHLLLEAIHKLEAQIHKPKPTENVDQIQSNLVEMSEAIRRTRQEIASLKLPDEDDNKFMGATEELDAIIRATERATHSILHAAEDIQETIWRLREEGASEAPCARIDTQITDIYTACSFQDITGQRTHKVVQVLHYIESRLNAMISIWGIEGAGVDRRDVIRDIRPDAHLLHGPQLEGRGLKQNDVDDVLLQIQQEIEAQAPVSPQNPVDLEITEAPSLLIADHPVEAEILSIESPPYPDQDSAAMALPVQTEDELSTITDHRDDETLSASPVDRPEQSAVELTSEALRLATTDNQLLSHSEASQLLTAIDQSVEDQEGLELGRELLDYAAVDTSVSVGNHDIKKISSEFEDAEVIPVSNFSQHLLSDLSEKNTALENKNGLPPESQDDLVSAEDSQTLEAINTVDVAASQMDPSASESRPDSSNSPENMALPETFASEDASASDPSAFKIPDLNRIAEIESRIAALQSIARSGNETIDTTQMIREINKLTDDLRHALEGLKNFNFSGSGETGDLYQDRQGPYEQDSDASSEVNVMEAHIDNASYIAAQNPMDLLDHHDDNPKTENLSTDLQNEAISSLNAELDETESNTEVEVQTDITSDDALQPSSKVTENDLFFSSDEDLQDERKPLLDKDSINLLFGEEDPFEDNEAETVSKSDPAKAPEENVTASRDVLSAEEFESPEPHSLKTLNTTSKTVLFD